MPKTRRTPGVAAEAEQVRARAEQGGETAMTLTIAGLVVAVVVAVLTAAGIAAGAVWFLSGRIDSSRVEVLTQVNQLDSKNEAAHAGIVARVDRLDTKSEAGHAEIGRMLDAVAHDVAFLAGRQKERDHRDSGGT